MAKRDFYEVLGVPRKCDATVLKASYRKLAMQFHPDRNPGDHTAEIKFKEVSEAYECLKDPQRRAAYDRFGHAAFENGHGGGFTNDFASSMSEIFDDIFGDFMGRGRGQSRSGGRERGADLRYNMELTLEEAYSGKTAQISVPTKIACEVCHGSGAKPGSAPRACPTCDGHGRVRASTGGFFSIERTCPTCQGRGEVISDPCEACGGAGRQTQERSLSVNIPAGIEDGTRIRLAGEGEAGLRGGPAGDLYIFLSIKPHAFLQRDGADLFCRVPVSVTTAALGGQFEVPTIDGGRTKVKIAEGTQTGEQFRLKGKGMPVLRSSKMGDMYIQVTVETPRKLTRRQRELMQEFEAASSEENNPESTGFFARMRDLFEGLGGKTGAQ
ncbi:MAG: molecular chaperone DnaJ [Bauldia sp.]